MVIKRPRLMHTGSLEERLNIEAQRLRKEASGTPPGVDRSSLIRRARLAETTSQLSEWLRTPGLRAPT
ncbi:hypothetical protein SAMN05444164_2006 [Bradyrhizobium erythrophlei]|uniref:Uncharacterized protein n=1 Tax=Bradyrhizobium erythrophlei TaxID=1437360 RepID=A0A1H4T2J9_9BRAD|nr:hypothetical protein [Bradyrhizobium erythrophlei]SEC50652.1 hypothetical protein SAMN05444164_2006 [Bradyrhizobium erythrophlei]